MLGMFKDTVLEFRFWVNISLLQTESLVPLPGPATSFLSCTCISFTISNQKDLHRVFFVKVQKYSIPILQHFRFSVINSRKGHFAQQTWNRLHLHITRHNSGSLLCSEKSRLFFSCNINALRMPWFSRVCFVLFLAGIGQILVASGKQDKTVSNYRDRSKLYARALWFQ